MDDIRYFVLAPAAFAGRQPPANFGVDENTTGRPVRQWIDTHLSLHPAPYPVQNRCLIESAPCLTSGKAGRANPPPPFNGAVVC